VAPARSSAGRLWRTLVSPLRDPTDPEVREERRRVLLERSRVACWIAFTLLPFTFVVYLGRFHPERLKAGIVATTIAVSAVAALWLALRRGLFDRCFHLPFFLLMGVICNFSQGALLQLGGGGATSDIFFPYFLIFFGMATLFPTRLSWASLTCALTVATYPVSEWLGHALLGNPWTLRAVVVNGIRLFEYAFITLIGNRVISDLFVRERRSQVDLKRANEKLRELDRLKSDFFATISHELRTPLTLILAPVASLLDGDAALSNRERALLGTIQGNAARLLALINDLLMLTRLDAGKVERRADTVDVAEACERVIESAQPMAMQLGLQLELSAGSVRPAWIGDRQHLERALLNLVSNACKFSNKGGRVRIGVDQAPGFFTIGVQDEGVGIAPADRDRIFDRFFQAESQASRRFEGSGIGLAIVKELVQLHGGSVAVESELGRGTTLRVRLPRAESAPAPACVQPAARPADAALETGTLLRLQHASRADRESAPASPIGDPDNRPTVILIEDNKDLLDYLAGELESEFHVVATADSEEGLRRALESPPDLVLSDVMMPRLDGIELCRRLRADPRARRVPVVLLSARGDVETKVGGFSQGADDYVQKPFELAELRARIHLQLRLRAQEASLARRNQELSRLTRELGGALKQLKEAEVRLVESEKMATLGVVVAGVAHEINNPLHFVKGNLALLRRMVPARAEGSSVDPEALFEDLRSSVDRMAEITRALYTLAGRDTGARERVDLARLLALVTKLLSVQIAPTVRVCGSFGEAPEVRASSQGMFQVLVNLVQNAVQAVGARGEVAVASRRLGDGSVAITVRDDGPGIPEEHIVLVFEPFFTTKPAGQGTGLGLSIASRIVADHGGDLSVESEPGRGSAFTVRLPQSTARLSKDALKG
jgi:signal transduction histidine kinase